MAEKPTERPDSEADGKTEAGEPDIKVILLGDSAVGKSKLVERYLMNDYHPRQKSTYAVTLYSHEAEVDGEKHKVEIWDTAGQERFSSMHPSYYFRAHACILAFDVTRKATYQNLSKWYKELRANCETVPVILVANKIDVNYEVTKKKFKFPEKHDLPFYFVSAADGSNVVKTFQEAIRAGVEYKKQGGDFVEEVMELLSDSTLDADHRQDSGPGKEAGKEEPSET